MHYDIFLSVILRQRGDWMAGKNDLQKTVAFRLNLSRADERELFQEILKHGRNVENNIYGSSGAYVKAALRHYHRQESKLELRERNRQEMRNYLRELAAEQGKVFLEKLVEHDKKLISMVVGAAMDIVGGIKSSDAGTNEEQSIGNFGKRSAINSAEDIAVEQTKAEQSERAGENKIDEGLPEEALFYLSNL